MTVKQKPKRFALEEQKSEFCFPFSILWSRVYLVKSRGFPEDITVSDIMAELYFRQNVDESLKELDEGKGISREEAKKNGFYFRFPLYTKVMKVLYTCSK